jgi:hypothetical protein
MGMVGATYKRTCRRLGGDKMTNRTVTLTSSNAKLPGRFSEGRTSPDRNRPELSFELVLETILFGGVGSNSCPAATSASRCLWRQVLAQ